MNTMTLSETTAVATAVARLAVGQQHRLIPLSKLRPSSRNVRRSGGTSIPELAASIARLGLLQNLAVVASADGEHFDVVAGRRRLTALKLPHATIVSAKAMAAGAVTMSTVFGPQTLDVPARCEVRGVSRPSADSQRGQH